MSAGLQINRIAAREQIAGLLQPQKDEDRQRNRREQGDSALQGKCASDKVKTEDTWSPNRETHQHSAVLFDTEAK
jgi:hypothetical protein